MPQQTHDTLPPLSSQLQALIQLGSWPLRCPKRPPSEHEPRNARRRKSKQRQLKEETLFLCGWLLLFSSLPPSQWTDEQVLALYRARWQVEIVIKRMKQVLRLAQLRGQTASTNEATILALLLAWALLQEEVQHARQVLTEAAEQWALSLCAPGVCEPRPAGCLPTVSSWTTTALGVQTLRLLVQGYWTFARLRHCLPYLQHFLCSCRRQRDHQESTIPRLLFAHPALTASDSSLIFFCSSA